MVVDEVGIKAVHMAHRDRCPVHVLHVDIRYVKSDLEQREVECRKRAKELGTPDPWIGLQRRVRSYQYASPAVQFKFLAPISFPCCRLLKRSRNSKTDDLVRAESDSVTRRGAGRTMAKVNFLS